MKTQDLSKIARLLERHGLDRRTFLKAAASAGLLTLGGTTLQSCTTTSSAKGKIVIVGGGAAGISMAARLKRWLDQPDITLIDPSDRQYFQPGFTLIASGVYQPDDVWKKQEDCMPSGIKWVKDSVVAVDPVRNNVTTQANGTIDYDFLVLVPGIQINWDHIEGMSLETLGQGNANSAYDFNGAQRTWQAMQEFSKTGGKGVFTDTHTKHKCGGVPKKITLLTEHYTRQQGTRDNVDLNFFTHSAKLYDVPYYTPRLEEIFSERNIPINLNVSIKGIDTQAKQVYFVREETVDGNKQTTEFKEDYDFLHFTPPMSAPDFVREAGLGWTEGKLAREAWVMVDQETLVHKTYPNIISLGDVAGIPTSKTSAAVRKQVPVAAKNLISLMEGKEPVEKYDGYAACPIVTDYGHVLLCEFNYDKEPETTFPFTLLDTSREQWAAWLLKVYILKPFYFYGMLTGWA